jgi:hypothetical protein
MVRFPSTQIAPSSLFYRKGSSASRFEIVICNIRDDRWPSLNVFEGFKKAQTESDTFLYIYVAPGRTQ